MAIVPLRTCKVSIADVDGIEHSVEVTAVTLYEAVAAGWPRFVRRMGWPDRNGVHHDQCQRPTARDRA